MSDDKKYLKEQHTITDAYGNKIAYDLQSVKNSVSSVNGGSDQFEGYLVAAMNIGPENGNYEGIAHAAKEFISQHPELASRVMKNNDGSYNTSSLNTAYMQWLVLEETSRHCNQGNATALEKAYSMQQTEDFRNGNKFWTAEQLEGAAPLNRDSLRQGMKADAMTANSSRPKEDYTQSERGNSGVSNSPQSFER